MKEFYLSTTTDDDDLIKQSSAKADSSLLRSQDILPISLFATGCLAAALFVSTYEDYDVTHVRPNPSTLRRPTSSSPKYYFGAATKGMGWGISERMADDTINSDEFEKWYGSSATTLQWKPSYNEIMLEHRSKRVPRWINEEIVSSSAKSMTTYRREEIQEAVMNLYRSLDELDNLKIMADNYQWDDIKTILNPNNQQSSLRETLEYSMDVLKSSSTNYLDDLSTVIGFDWGSCAWRHCGAKADGQEALAEFYSSVGMLEPFECRFVIGKVLLPVTLYLLII